MGGTLLQYYRGVEWISARWTRHMGFGVKSSLLFTGEKFHTQVQITDLCVCASSLAGNYCLEWIIIYLCLPVPSLWFPL